MICLHVHTEYSLQDGIIRPKELVDYVKELGMTTVAITDHGNMHGVIDFYKSCIEGNIKPLVGIEAYITSDLDNTEKKTRDNAHLVLLAKNNKGYHGLLKLCSNAYLNNFYYKPRIYIGYLRDYSEDLIATTACLAGPVASAFRKGEGVYGENALDNMLKIFGENLYAEIQDNQEPEQKPYNQWLVHVCNRKGVPLIITSDAHYLKKEDFTLHEMTMAMQLKLTLAQYRAGNKMVYTPDYYIKTPSEFELGAKKYGAQDAIDNCDRIGELCNVEIELGKLSMPTFDITKTTDYQDFLKWKEQQHEENISD